MTLIRQLQAEPLACNILQNSNRKPLAGSFDQRFSIRRGTLNHLGQIFATHSEIGVVGDKKEATL